MRPFVYLFASVAILSFAGCGGESNRQPSPEEMASAPPPPPAMSAQDQFFGGKLLVEATLARAGRPGAGTHGGEGGGKKGGGGGRRHRHNDDSGDYGSGGGGSESSGEEGEQFHYLRDSPYPAVALRLHATNQASTSLEVFFLECNSALGNFVIHPDHAIINSSESVDTEPMNSRLGVAGDIPVTVTVKMGGQSETKVLTLHAVSSAKPTPAAAPSK